MRLSITKFLNFPITQYFCLPFPKFLNMMPCSSGDIARCVGLMFRVAAVETQSGSQVPGSVGRNPEFSGALHDAESRAFSFAHFPASATAAQIRKC